MSEPQIILSSCNIQINIKEKRMSENKVIWHPYPQEKPKEGMYFVTIDDDGRTDIDVISYPYGFGNYPNDYLQRTFVTAWAELPEPYKEENNG